MIKSEEERFHETLEEGLSILNQLIEKAKKDNHEIKGKMHLNCMILMVSL